MDPQGDYAVNEGREPWIETRQGGWFFVNALLVAPELVVLFPLAVGALASLLAPDRPLSPFLDTIPFVASKSIPFLGWLLVVPIWTTVKNIRMEGLLLPRLALGFFLVSHLGFLAFTLWSWVG
jgi:hypothetical protein